MTSHKKPEQKSTVPWKEEAHNRLVQAVADFNKENAGKTRDQLAEEQEAAQYAKDRGKRP